MPAAAAHASSTAFASVLQALPSGAAPTGAIRAHGARFWNAQGRGYVDFCNGFGTVILGYGDPAIEAALHSDLSAARLVEPVAEAVAAMVPCAEAVRFGAGTSYALAEAVRAACAYTGRARVLACAPAPASWPRAEVAEAGSTIASLASVFPHDDLPVLEALLGAHAGETAAILLAPMNVEAASFGYLHAVRRLADRHGAVLIFDESVTGFRFHEGGAQALFGITPDLAVFGPGLANGLPLSALAGRAELVALADADAFRPDARALAAAVVLRRLQLEPVITTLRVRGAEVQAETEALLASTGADRFLRIAGDPTWSGFVCTPPPGSDPDLLRRLFLTETAARGLIVRGEHAISYAHGDDEISHLVDVYAEAFPLLVEAAA